MAVGGVTVLINVNPSVSGTPEMVVVVSGLLTSGVGRGWEEGRG